MATRKKIDKEETKEQIDVAEATEIKEVEVAAEKDKEVVAESTHQMGIFSAFIYNVENEDAEVIIENLGYGDVYVSTADNATVGDESQRILFREKKSFEGAVKLFAISASQPVISIIEVK